MNSSRVVERFLQDVLNGVDVDGASELLADETLRQRVGRFRAAFPDLRTETEHIVAEGDLVAVHLRGRATHTGIFQGCPPTGRSWASACTAIYRIDSGRIVDSRGGWDLLGLLEQLGVVRRGAGVSA